ncbi:hypothetical protein [Pedobacter sp.]
MTLQYATGNEDIQVRCPSDKEEQGLNGGSRAAVSTAALLSLILFYLLFFL